ncbi:FecR domain-containing protein [Bordetella tumulicola]|uniref:FecR domain-containing protein n=1 Tax=Bordetella tumulicola TaxID=1649133 RepID=UPI0039F026A1
MSLQTSPSIDPQIAAEAADWLVLMHSGNCSVAQQHACDRWRQSSAENERAWRRAQEVLSKLGALPPELSRAALNRPQRHDRRAAMRTLAGLALAVPSGWLAWHVAPWQTWTADQSTGVGEQRRLDLPDGSLLTLNTASAVDIAFTPSSREIALRTGEILVEMTHSARYDARPLRVRTDNGIIQSTHSRFTVRQFADHCAVAVIEGGIDIEPSSGSSVRLTAGYATTFSSTAASIAHPVLYPPQAWAQGVLYADAMSLDDFAAEINRYRPGIVRCDPQIAHLRVSGAFQLSHTDTALRAVTHSLPVQLVYRTRYWVTLAAV